MNATTAIRPEPGSYPAFYASYVGRVGEGLDPLELLSVQPTAVHQLLEGLTDEQATFRYAPGKWSIKQMVLHLTDTERIFAYRALRFARADAQSLPGFDENHYADHCGADERSLESLLAEYAAVRQATLTLFRSFTDAQLNQTGNANGNPVTVRAIVFITAGHEAHHLAILTQRYLSVLNAEA